jgi:hypothetical protein
MTTEEALPEPSQALRGATLASLLDTMREQMLCGGRCPPLTLERPSPSGFELSLWRCGRDFKVRVTSHGTVLRERHGESLSVNHIEPAEAEALAQSFARAHEQVERQPPVVVRPVDALLERSVWAREYVDLERDGTELAVVGPPCKQDREAFPLADEIDRVAHVID